MFFTEILYLLFFFSFPFYKKLPLFFPLNPFFLILLLLLYSENPKQTSATYCPWASFPTSSSVYLKTLLLRHPFSFFLIHAGFALFVLYFFPPALNPLPQPLHIQVILPLIPPNHSDNQNCIVLPCSQF